MSNNKNLLELYIDSGINTFFKNHKSSSVEYNYPNKNDDNTLKDSLDEYRHIGSLADICQSIKAFEGCAIKKTSINTVIYDGNPNASIMLIGEAPGATEDHQGIPFCGQSGKLLDNILKSIDLARDQDVFITNTVFWRPPGNRRPTTEEIRICRPFLEKIIAIVNPKIIILVGSTAVESVLNIKTVSMNDLRGQYHAYLNHHLKIPIPTTTIFHPSYLLRQPNQKKAMWFDILKIKNMIATL